MKIAYRTLILYLIFFFPSIRISSNAMSVESLYTIPAVGYFDLVEEIDLKGQEITLPSNLTVFFKGGSFKNGIIICDNNCFIGVRGFCSDVILTGTVNGVFNIGWYILENETPSFDIAPIINHVAKEFVSFEVPAGTYYFRTPILISSAKNVIIKGNLIYNGTSKDISAVTFKDCVSSNLELIGSIRYDRASNIINYTNKNHTNIVGVEFVNVKQSLVTVADVRYFNTNMKVSAWGDGNAYNQYHIGLLYCANKQLHVYQRDLQGGKGWCNENIFYGGRYGNPSNLDQNHCESYAIYIEGDTTKDSYNHVNSLLFLKPCTEGYKGSAIYAKNTHGCQWLYGRNEGSDVYVKFIGNCQNNEIRVSYGTDSIDISECTTYPLVVGGWNKVDEEPKQYQAKSETYELDAAGIDFVKIDFAGNEGRVGVVYLDDNNNVLQTIEAPKTLSSGSFFYSTSNKMWMNGAPTSSCSFYIPDNVKRIRLTVYGERQKVQIQTAKQ